MECDNFQYNAQDMIFPPLDNFVLKSCRRREQFDNFLEFVN